ncbi:MAG TPA: hypothetical protein VGE37_10815 [Archangium sp.]
MRFPGLIIVPLLSLALVGCEDRTRTRKVVEPFDIVPGTPSVDDATPAVRTDTTMATGNFGVNVPKQCDAYTQLPVRKVDILWVVDSSGSMAPKQARLAANFQGFINQLVTANPPIDFHIAVTSTDTDDAAARGKLRAWTLGATTENFISCTPQATGGVSCNTGPNLATAIQAFGQMSAVGINGSASERGLYAAYLALTEPTNISNDVFERFIRPDAALYVVVVSDEDDASCTPMTRQSSCTADPGCRCAPNTALGGAGTWGSTEYFVRFLETYKGYGNQDSVALASIVATDEVPVPSQFGDPNPHVGCCRVLDGGTCPGSGTNDGGFEIAYTGSRYLEVANATGGVAVSICQQDFSAALSSLGYAASGLRRDFRLSRGPDVRPDGGTAEGLTTFISPSNAANCMVDGNCPMATPACRNGRCARKVAVSTTSQANGASYLKCEGAGLRNIVRFEGTSVPEPLSTVEVCYDVLPTFQNSCP